jgi:hypothetical protein
MTTMHGARTTGEYMDQLFAKKRRRENPHEAEAHSASPVAYAVYTSGLCDKIRLTIAEFLENTAEATPVDATKRIMSDMATQIHLDPSTARAMVAHFLSVHAEDILASMEKGTDKKKISSVKPAKEAKEVKA